MPGWKIKNGNGNQIECSLCKSPVVYLEPIVKHKIELLMDEYPSSEWLGYLVGRISKENNIFVEELSIPPHKDASSASAEAEPFNIPDRCVGIIHSHHSMGAFHSGTDQAYVDKNFPVSITVAKKGQIEFDAVSYQITPCKKATTGKSLVKFVLPKPAFDTEVFMKQAKENIDKGKRVYTHHYGNQTYLNGKDNYTPLRYRLYPNYNGEVFTDEHGVVLTDREIQEAFGGL